MTGPADVTSPGGDIPELRYYTRFVPRAARVDPALADVDVIARYRAPTPPDPATMHRDADTLRDVAAALHTHLLVQEQAAARLDSAWQGTAADAAATATHLRLEHARAVCSTMSEAALTLDGAAALIHEALSARAALVDGLDPSAVGGRSVAQIDRMLADDTDRAWLGEVFVPHVRTHLAALSALAAALTDLVDGVTGLIERVVDGVDAQNGAGAQNGDEERDGVDVTTGVAAPDTAPPVPDLEQTPAFFGEAPAAPELVAPHSPEFEGDGPGESVPGPEPAESGTAGDSGTLGFTAPRPGRGNAVIGPPAAAGPPDGAPVPPGDVASGADLAGAGPM